MEMIWLLAWVWGIGLFVIASLEFLLWWLKKPTNSKERGRDGNL